MKILVDAMGGDNAPLCVLLGVSQAAAEFGDGMELVLLGEEKAIRDCAKENKIDLAPFEILNCTETIDMHDDPVKAVRHKKDSSLVKGLTMLKNGEADAFVSAGSTGALHVGTSLIVRTVKGVKRPALATPMPGAKQNFLLLDCGANVECRPEMLNAFGTMGSVYAEKVMGRETPKVALVNNGAEDTKGTPTYREAHKLLKANPCIHFAGNIEPRYIMDGDVDVVVCDGFVGNVVLKLTEGVAKTLLGMLKKIFLQNLITKLSYLGIKGGLGELKRMMDSEEVGGAPLLGIRLGEKNEKEASRILANAFLMLVSLSLVLTAAALFLTRPMLMAFGASTVTYPYARAYFMIYVSGSVFALLSTGLNQFVICQGFASEGMKSVLLGAVLNLLLDPVFIFVLHLGVRGAAIATVLSQIASCLYVLHILFGKTIPIRITFGGYSFAIMKRILTVGFTPFLIIAIDNVMIIAMNAVLQRYAPAGQGDSFITCATIVQSFMLIITIPLGGISGGTQSILAYNYGAGNSGRILEAQKTIIALCAGFTTLMFLVSNAAGTLFAQLFTSDPQIVSMVVRAIHISTLSVIPLGIQYEIVDGFTAMGCVRYSFALSFFRKFVYFTALFLLPRFFALENIFYVEPISDLIGPVVSMIVYWTSIQKILKQREEAVRLMHTKKA